MEKQKLGKAKSRNRIYFYFLVSAFYFSSCGVARYSASTTAIYKISPDGKLIEYSSNKEHEGIEIEVKEVDGRAQTIVIKVAQSGTSEAAVAAALQSNLRMTEIFQKLLPLIEKAAMAGS